MKRRMHKKYMTVSIDKIKMGKSNWVKLGNRKKKRKKKEKHIGYVRLKLAREFLSVPSKKLINE